MNVFLDASSAINLDNGLVLDTVLSLLGYTFKIGPQTLDECRKRHPNIERLIAEGKLQIADDGKVPAQRFEDLIVELELGLGETECIALAELDDRSNVSCDDRKARTAITDKLGKSRLVGSLGLLRECVRKKLLTGEAAHTAYETMRAKGGFLPDIPNGFFEH